MINKTSVFLMMFILISFPSFCMEASPILGYQSVQKHSDNYHYVMLKYARTHEVLPMLRNICRDCDWVIDHTRQSVGLMVKKSEWDVYKKALLALDKRRPMIRIDVAVVEVSNIQSERYRQLLSHLTKPTKLTTSIEGVIELMISSGNATLVSSPRLIGKSGASVKLKVGDQMPYKTAIQNATSIQTNIQYIHSGIELKITPYLHYDHLIDLDIELHYSAMRGMQQEGGVDMPMIASRTSELSLQVPQNSTVIFAGLLDKSFHNSIEKVPVLGDLPWIGSLFQRSIRKEQVTDLIYKITPRLLP